MAPFNRFLTFRKFQPQCLDEGGLARAIRPNNSNLLAASNAKTKIVDNGSVTIAFGQMLDRQNLFRSKLARFELKFGMNARAPHRLNNFHLFNLFNAALRLSCLRCLIAKSFDESLLACDVLFLCDNFLLFLQQEKALLGFEGGVIARIGSYGVEIDI